MKPTNVKISFKVASVPLSTVAQKCKALHYKVKEYSNFLVIRLDIPSLGQQNLVCTVFKKKLKCKSPQHVNVTNIKSLDRVPNIINQLSQVGLEANPHSTTIDNVTGLMSCERFLVKDVLANRIFHRMDHVCCSINHIFGGTHTLSVSYNNERFPGIFLKFWRDKRSKIGTAIVFHTGKVVFVGCKSIQMLECLAKAVSALILTK